jgi:2-polyprenyl-3-methyl-5-hydroxy-6-metoxy-1,4-benzoquinol methylase
MEDFRLELYQKYVSRFKGSYREKDESQKHSYYLWCQEKYLTHFTNINLSDRILEIGCGDGKFLEFLKQKGYENVIGIDISDEQVNLAKEKGLNAVRADVFEFLSKNENTFDAIVAIDTVEHFTKSEVLLLFQSIEKSLKENGLLLLQTPNGEGLFPGQVIYGDLTHLCIFTENSLRQVLSLYGFHNIAVYETSPLPIGLSGKMRLVIWSIIKSTLNFIRTIEGGKGKKIRFWTENIIAVCRKN